MKVCLTGITTQAEGMFAQWVPLGCKQADRRAKGKQTTIAIWACVEPGSLQTMLFPLAFPSKPKNHENALFTECPGHETSICDPSHAGNAPGPEKPFAGATRRRKNNVKPTSHTRQESWEFPFKSCKSGFLYLKKKKKKKKKKKTSPLFWRSKRGEVRDWETTTPKQEMEVKQGTPENS